MDVAYERDKMKMSRLIEKIRAIRYIIRGITEYCITRKFMSGLNDVSKDSLAKREFYPDPGKETGVRIK